MRGVTTRQIRSGKWNRARGSLVWCTELAVCRFSFIAAIFLGFLFGIYFENSKRGSDDTINTSFTSVFRVCNFNFCFCLLSFPCVLRFLRDQSSIEWHYQLSSGMRDRSSFSRNAHERVSARILLLAGGAQEIARSAFFRYCRDIKFILPFPDTLLLLSDVCRRRGGDGVSASLMLALYITEKVDFVSYASFRHSRYLTYSKWMSIRFVYSQQTRYLVTKRWILPARFM